MRLFLIGLSMRWFTWELPPKGVDTAAQLTLTDVEIMKQTGTRAKRNTSRADTRLYAETMRLSKSVVHACPAYRYQLQRFVHHISDTSLERSCGTYAPHHRPPPATPRLLAPPHFVFQVGFYTVTATSGHSRSCTSKMYGGAKSSGVPLPFRQRRPLLPSIPWRLNYLRRPWAPRMTQTSHFPRLTPPRQMPVGIIPIQYIRVIHHTR